MRFLKLTFVSSILIVGCAFAQPSVFSGGVIDGATFTKGQAVAPGSVVSIFGSGLAAATLGGDTVPLSTTIGSTSVSFNGEAAPLYFVSSGQVNAQLPWDLQAGNSDVMVTNGSSSSAAVSVPVAQFSPGIYSIPAGAGYAVAINNSDQSIAAPARAIPGITTHPAKAGDVMIMYANGLGPVSLTGKAPASPPALGAASLDATRYTLTVPQVLVGGTPAQVIFSGLTPQFVGINQINFVVPSVTAGSSIPIQ